MEKITQRMSKGNLGIGVGIASLALSGCLLISNEKEIKTLENEKSDLVSDLKEAKSEIDKQNDLMIELNKSLESTKTIMDGLNQDLDEMKKENEVLKSEIEKIRIAKEEEKKKQEAVKKQQAVENSGIVLTSSSNYYETTMEVTAYTAGYESTQKKKGDAGYGLTASGAYVKEGVTIACPKSMEFGTVIEIEGYGKRVCQDRGGAIKNGKLDLYMDSLSEAKNFGRQKLKVKVYNG